MINLETSYLGLKLRNPIIVSSSGLTNSIDKLKSIEENGAGAVVSKSLFEEQIDFEAGHLLNKSDDYPEAEDYIRNYVKSNSVETYIELIEEAKKTLSIPVFASINCVSSKDWTSFAKKIEEAGADALELNIYILPTNKNISGIQLEEEYYRIVDKVRKNISIPLVIKLGYNFTNLMNVVERISVLVASAVVLFNRYYEPDIDIDHQPQKADDSGHIKTPRKAFSKLAVELSDEDLKSQGVQKLLLDEISRLENAAVHADSYRDKFNESNYGNNILHH